jgi:opacity protein-like surface antigen
MHVRQMIIGAATAVALMSAPAVASADWTFSPFLGSTFIGDLNDIDLELSIDMGAGIAGFEVDFGYTPEFFFNEDDTGIDFIGDGAVTTLMGNVVIGIPVGGQSGPGIRPYGTAGIGWMRSSVDDIIDEFDIDDNSWGFNLGGGVMGMFTDNVGIRGDLRYFRSFRTDVRDDIGDLDFDLSGLNYWRGSVGVTFRFGN